MSQKKKRKVTKVPYHHTLDITDASKLSNYMDCPRQYFYRYVLGWSREGSNIHLVFGEGWHRAMEHLLLNGYEAESIKDAYDVFLDYYREHYHESDDKINFPKSPESVLPALAQYTDTYQRDDFEVMHTEVAGTVSIDDERVCHFRLDAVVRDKQGIYCLEHKTASRLTSTWTSQWSLSMQVNLYIHALYMMFPNEKIYGVKVNGTIFRKSGCEFIRVPVRKTPDMMQVWWWNTLHWLDMLDWNFEQLEKSNPLDDIMMAFPMNTGNCTKYFGCAYQDFCKVWPNPLKKISDGVPLGFVESRWDPSARDEDAKLKVELTDKGGKIIK